MFCVNTRRILNKIKAPVFAGVLVLTVLTGVFGPWFTPKALAQWQWTLPFIPEMGSEKLDTLGKALNDQCGAVLFFNNIGTCVLKGGATILDFLHAFMVKLSTLLVDTLTGFMNMSVQPGASVAREIDLAWGYVRDFANLFLIIILVFIGIGTILDVSRFSWENMLPKLLLIALVINFSKFFTVSIIDFANSIGSYIMAGAGGVDGIKDALGAGLGLNKLIEVDSTAALNSAQEVYDVIMAGLYRFLIDIVIVFAFAAGLIFFAVRMLILWLLIMASPIAFLTYIWGGSISRTWWSKLISWSFFAPIYIFFIWIGMRLITNGLANDIRPQFNPTDSGAFYLFFHSFINYFLSFILTSTVIIGSLLAANSMGVHFSNRVMTWGKQTALAVSGGTARLAGRGLAAGPRALLMKRRERSEDYQKMAADAARIPIVGGMIGRAMTKGLINQRKRVDEYRKQFKDEIPEVIAGHASRAGVTREERVAAVQELAAKGKTNLVSERVLDSALTVSKGLGLEKEILQARPDKAGLVGKTIPETLKGIKPEKIDLVSSESYKNPDGTVKSYKKPDGTTDEKAVVETFKDEKTGEEIKLDMLGSMFKNGRWNHITQAATKNIELFNAMADRIGEMTEEQMTQINAGLAKAIKKSGEGIGITFKEPSSTQRQSGEEQGGGQSMPELKDVELREEFENRPEQQGG
jgi:hypothetical protein